MTQIGLIDKILKTTGMVNCNGKQTPAMIMPLGTDAEGKVFQEDWNYASVIGMLLYLCSNSRPDIQFAVHQCARFTHCPRNSHAEAIKRICRYLQATKNKGLVFKPDKMLKLDCYVDADFAGLWKFEPDNDPVCVKSQIRYMVFLGFYSIITYSKL